MRLTTSGYVESERKAGVFLQDTKGKASVNELLPQDGNLAGLLDSTQGKGSVKAMRELAGYNIWRGDFAGPWSLLTFTTETSYVDEDVILDLTYCYKITAVYADTESEPTEEDCVFVGDWGTSDDKSERVLIYPVPAPGIINIEHTGNLNRVIVFNYAGQVVYEQSVLEDQFIKINVSSYETGVYLVKLINSAGESFTRKVVVAR